MFDIGFSELVMIGLVSLIVIGPERLPKVARIVGFWLGKSRAMIANVKSEIQYELHQEELRQMLIRKEHFWRRYSCFTRNFSDLLNK